MPAIITDFALLLQVWNDADSIDDVAARFNCCRNVLYQSRKRALHLYPKWKFKKFIRDPIQTVEVHIAKPCSAPTSACIGTKDKVEVLRQRLERGEDLWHPQDKVDFSGIDTLFVRNGTLDLRPANSVRLKGRRAS